MVDGDVLVIRQSGAVHHSILSLAQGRSVGEMLCLRRSKISHFGAKYALKFAVLAQKGFSRL